MKEQVTRGSKQRDDSAAERGVDLEAKSELSYSKEAAPAARTNRRVFLKLSLGASAAIYSSPRMAFAQAGGGLSGVPVSLPFNDTLVFTNQLGQLSGDMQSVYSFDASGTIAIDTLGQVTISGVSATGTYVSGDDVGTISVSQTSTASGTYSGTTLSSAIPVQITDDTGTATGPAVLSGTLVAGAADLDFGFQTIPNGHNWGIGVVWGRSF